MTTHLNQLLRLPSAHEPRYSQQLDFHRQGTPPPSLHVVLVRWGSKYGPPYVQRLLRDIATYLSYPYETHLFTDDPSCPAIAGLVDHTHLLRPGLHGWWNKLAMFGNVFPPGARVLYFDLDVIIMGDLSPIVACADPFVMISNFGPNRPQSLHNSSVMLWTPSVFTRQVVDLYEPEVAKKLHGDQCWLWRVMRDGISNFPKGLVVSYKYDCRRAVPHSASVVVFHGDPKPIDASPWWANRWRYGPNREEWPQE